MTFLCAECGNYTYFECDVQVHQSVKPTKEGLIVEDATFEDFNWSDSNIRDGLEDSVGYALKQNADVLQCNPDTGHYENTLITCARCGSKRVTPPYSKWSPKNYKSVYKEILENREEFKHLRKEKTYHANTLPVLWEP